jgi:hypothetical protein
MKTIKTHYSKIIYIVLGIVIGILILGEVAEFAGKTFKTFFLQ